MKPSDIESELSQIWDGMQKTKKMRASLFNLIVYTPKNGRTPYVESIAQKIIERFPSRVIFVSSDKNSQQEVVSANATMMPVSGDVVCDWIEFEGTAKTKERLPYLVLPHILPDLPVYIVWEEDPTVDNPLSYRLDKFATRLIFDSETTTDLVAFSKLVLELYKDSHCAVADLNWGRTENWRELLTATFHSPERLEQLRRLKTLRIVYNAFETPFFCHTKIQALYLQAWLATQLDWKLKNVTADGFLYDGVSVELTAEKNTDLPSGTIVSVDLETTQGEHFSFARIEKLPHQVIMIISDAEKCEMPSKYIFTKSQRGLSLVNEICKSGTSEHYIKLIELLSTLQPHALSCN